jgi:hypothetical protein
MEFKKYKPGEAVSHHGRNAKESMPLGARKHKSSKAHRWRKSRPRKDQGVSFSLTGSCSGELSEVMSLGVRLAKEAMAEGDADMAQHILNRVKKLPMEYRRAELMAQRERIIKKLSTLTK